MVINDSLAIKHSFTLACGVVFFLLNCLARCKFTQITM